MLMDPIALPCYIASGLFFKNLGGALAASVGFNVVFRVVLAAISSNGRGGVETGSLDFEAIAASIIGAALVTAIVYFFASKRRKRVAKERAKDERDPRDMAMFTREQIAEMHGGGTRGYLPHADGRVVCACLRLDYNPGAPAVILPGDNGDVQHWASVLCQQGGAIPIYVRKEESNVWEYVGKYEVVGCSSLPADIAKHSRHRHAAKIPISSVITMRQTSKVDDHDAQPRAHLT